MEMELVPPGYHCRNTVEVAIMNSKPHFLSVLAGTASDCPPLLWNRLLPQADITVNLLRQSNATPNVSAYAHLSGPFDYNKMPLSQMGCAVQVHETTDKRGTWAYHTVDGWYLSMPADPINPTCVTPRRHTANNSQTRHTSATRTSPN